MTSTEIDPQSSTCTQKKTIPTTFSVTIRARVSVFYYFVIVKILRANINMYGRLIACGKGVLIITNNDSRYGSTKSAFPLRKILPPVLQLGLRKRVLTISNNVSTRYGSTKSAFPLRKILLPKVLQLGLGLGNFINL